MRLLVCALALLSVCNPLVAEDWPEFRGPTGQGLSTAKGVPVRWSATENIAWKQPIPGVGWSSPVLVDGRIYLTTAVKAEGAGDVSLDAVCVDAADGQIIWHKESLRPDATAAKIMHQKNSLASPSATVAGGAPSGVRQAGTLPSEGRMYVHFGHMGTAALDLDGNVLWRQTSLSYSPEHGNGGSPALVGDRLVFSADASKDPFVAALDRATGEVRWKVPRSGGSRQTFSFSTPLVIEIDGAKQIISPASGYVAAYDPQDGREIWRVQQGQGFSVIPRPVYAHGLLFVCTGYNRATLMAIDPKGASGDATATAVRWKTDRGAPLTPSPLVVGDELYFVSDNGVATCLDALSGKQHWTQRLGGAFSASPTFAHGHVFFLDEAGAMSVVKAGTTYELVAKNELGERSLASPAFADGTIFLRSESHLWRVGK